MTDITNPNYWTNMRNWVDPESLKPDYTIPKIMPLLKNHTLDEVLEIMSSISFTLASMNGKDKDYVIEKFNSFHDE